MPPAAAAAVEIARIDAAGGKRRLARLGNGEAVLWEWETGEDGGERLDWTGLHWELEDMRFRNELGCNGPI
jgi:hypothetical protein